MLLTSSSFIRMKSSAYTYNWPRDNEKIKALIAGRSFPAFPWPYCLLHILPSCVLSPNSVLFTNLMLWRKISTMRFFQTSQSSLSMQNIQRLPSEFTERT